VVEDPLTELDPLPVDPPELDAVEPGKPEEPDPPVVMPALPLPGSLDADAAPVDAFEARELVVVETLPLAASDV
jgi:hypothetical protein